MRGLLAGLVLGVVALGAAGCNEYHYYDVNVKFNVSAGNFAGITDFSTVQVIVMNVSGADNGSIQIGPNSGGLPATSSTVGVFEFSTFADSGTLTFTALAYNDSTSQQACQVGRGMVSATASSMTTNNLDLTIDKTGVGCANP